MAGRRGIILFNFIAHVSIVLSYKFYYNDTSDIIMDNCITDILTSKSQFRSLVTVINSDALSNTLLQQVHSSNNVNFCAKDFYIPIEVESTVYLVYAQNETEFDDLIDQLDRDWNRRPEALYIVVVKTKYSGYLTKIFKLLWEYHFIHALVIDKDMENDASIYTYFPYAEGRCGRDYSTIDRLCNCTSVKNIDVVGKLRDYDRPVLDNCTLQVAVRDYPPLVFCKSDTEGEKILGLEQFLIEIVLQKKNITLNYTCLPQTEYTGTISDNFTVDGIMNKLYENEVDFLFGGLSLNHKRAHLFDFLFSHLAYEDMYVTITHRSGLIERWRMLYMLFNINVWVLLLFTIIFCAAMLSDLENLCIMQTTYATTMEIFYLFGNATQNVILTRKKKLFKNFIVTHWLWFIFLMTCFYQTRLTSVTIYRLYKPQLDQYFSLYDPNYSPCISFDVVSFLENSGKVPVINKGNMVKGNCDTAEMSLDTVAETKNTYTVTMYFQYLWWLRNNVKHKERVHVMKESVYNNLYGLLFKRGFPLLGEFNALLLRLPENGFVHGSKNFHRLPSDLAAESANDLLKLVKSPIRLKDLAIPFGILATGTVLSFLAFMREMKYIRRIMAKKEF